MVKGLSGDLGDKLFWPDARESDGRPVVVCLGMGQEALDEMAVVLKRELARLGPHT